MPDYNFIAQPQVPNSFQTIGSVMNMAGQAQNLQRGGVALEQERATLQPNIRAAEARAQTAETGAKGAAFALQKDYIGTALNEAAALYKDPRIVNNDVSGTVTALTEARDRMIARGVPKDQAEMVTAPFLAQAHVPGAVFRGLQNVIQANAGAGTQAGVVNAPVSLVTTPAGAVAPVQLQPGAPGAVSPVPISSLQGNTPGVIPAGIPPAQRETPATDVLGQPVIAERDQAGNISYKAPPGSSARPIMQFPQGESAQTVPEVQAIRTQANAVGAAAPTQHFNNQQILSLAPEAFTGTGSGQLTKVLGAVGLQTTNNVSSDTAQLKHFIALQIEQNATAQGASTDAARSLAAQAVLPTDSPEKAIKNITKVNDAYVTGNELYNAGMEAAINNPNNQAGVFAARQFRNAWAQNFDPRITLLENAQKAGDKETIDRVLGPKGSAQRASAVKELTQKALKLQALSQGRL